MYFKKRRFATPPLGIHPGNDNQTPVVKVKIIFEIYKRALNKIVHLPIQYK